MGSPIATNCLFKIQRVIQNSTSNPKTQKHEETRQGNTYRRMLNKRQKTTEQRLYIHKGRDKQEMIQLKPMKH